MNLFPLVVNSKSLYKTAQLLRLLFDKIPSYFFWFMCDIIINQSLLETSELDAYSTGVIL